MQAPQALIARRQWVLWRREGPKDSKIPYTIGGTRRASSTNPLTWAPYYDVLRAFETHPEHYSGMGYVFAADDPFVGVDLDDCRDPASGVIAPWAVAILDDLATYAEVSPSGTGVKAWAVGALPAAVKTAHVEVYAEARYFAFTGQRLDGYPAEPQEAQAALDRLAAAHQRKAEPALRGRSVAPPTSNSHTERWAREVLARAVGMVTRAMDGEKHNELLSAARLAAGAMPHLSEQEIEETLFSVIRLRADDPRGAMQTITDGIRMGAGAPLEPPTPPTGDALVVKGEKAYCPSCGGEVRISKYPYPGTDEPGWYCPDCKGAMKWPRDAFVPPPETKLRDRTVAPPVAYEIAPPTPTTAPELARKDIPPTRYYIPDMLRSGLALFIGNPGIGKTPALMQLAIAFASGGMWLGAIPCRKSRVLYIGVEYDEAYIKEVMLDSAGTPDLPPELYILSVETFTSPATEDESLGMLDYYLRVMQIDVLIIDVFSGFLPREKFKQNAYRGDYAEFLAYHRLCMSHKALLVGAWHGTKRDKDPEMSYNGGQGMWGSAGGGRLTMMYDEDQQVRLRSQLRGHKRKEWLIEEAHAGGAHFWSVIDADPDPIFGSEAQRRIYQAMKKYSTRAEPLSPAGIKAIIQSDAPESVPTDAYLRQFCGRLVERGLALKVGGGYIVNRGSLGSGGTLGSGGSLGSQGNAQPPHTAFAQEAIQGGSLLEGRWIAPEAHQDAEIGGAIQAIHDSGRSTEMQGDPPSFSTDGVQLADGAEQWRVWDDAAGAVVAAFATEGEAVNDATARLHAALYRGGAQ